MTKINIGDGLGEMVLAAIIGNTKVGLAPTVAYLQGYRTDGLAARIAVNSRLGADTAGPGRGTVVAPYKTFGAAVTAAKAPTTLAGYLAPRTIDVQGGTHDVSLVILPMGNWIINLHGGAVLTGALRMQLNSALAFTSTAPPGVVVNNVDAALAVASYDSISFLQSPGTAVATVYVEANRVSTDSVLAAPATITTINVELDHASVGELLNTAVIMRAHLCAFGRDVSVDTITEDIGSRYLGDITVLNDSEFFSTKFNPAGAQTFTGPAGSARFDFETNFQWKAPGTNTLAGGSSPAIMISDTVAAV